MSAGTTPVSDVHEAVIDDATLDALVSDLTTYAQVLDVLVKGAPTHRTNGQVVALQDAVAWLRDGSVRGIQVRYRYDECEWRDTWLATGAGIRLVRVKTPES